LQLYIVLEAEMEKRLFEMSEVAKITGMKENRLKPWIYNGWVKPLKMGGGAGSRNKFTEDDILDINLMKKLLEAGIAREFAGQCVRQFRTVRPFLVPDEYGWFEIYLLRKNESGKPIYESRYLMKASDTLRDNLNCIHMIAINVKKLYEEQVAGRPAPKRGNGVIR
jgi:hypothetical protein